jgi:hypothetical protein
MEVDRGVSCGYEGSACGSLAGNERDEGKGRTHIAEARWEEACPDYSFVPYAKFLTECD